MKKFILCLTLLVSVLFSGFARSNNDLDAHEDSKEEVFSFNPGIRFSVLGFEPTFSLNVKNLEAEIGCALTTGYYGNDFGVAPNISIGYCTNPFDRGSFTTFGIEYLLVSDSYVKALYSEFKVDKIHAVSLYYKGGYKFTDAFGINWRLRLPLFMGGKSDDYSEFYNILSVHGGNYCVIAGLFTISAGVQFSIH